ncbi:MAG: aromatic amino acid lyase, partial [Rhodobacteraceae bacterium]|nr:aromatic amino acid lyase [Paracoccaceae bacterium]
MVAYAVAADLDNLAALIPLLRNEGESDTDFRVRVQLAPEGFSVAGPRGAYEFHARSADPAVLDVAIDTYDEANVAPGAPTLGEVHVYVLAAMIVRLNTLAKGHSGISKELLERLCLFVNHRIIPVIPLRLITQTFLFLQFNYYLSWSSPKGPFCSICLSCSYPS